MCRNPSVLGVYEDHCKVWGVRDNLNVNFVKKILSLSNSKGPQDVIDQVHADLTKQHQEHMFNPFLRLIGNALISLVPFWVEH